MGYKKRKDLTHYPIMRHMQQLLSTWYRRQWARVQHMDKESFVALRMGQNVQLQTFLRVVDKLGYELVLKRKQASDAN